MSLRNIAGMTGCSICSSNSNYQILFMRLKKKHNNPPEWTEWFIWKKISDPSTTYNINRINSGPAKGTITELGMQIGPSILCKTQTVQLLFTLNFITPREELGCICTHLYGHIPKKGSVTTHLSQNSNNFPLYLLL